MNSDFERQLREMNEALLVGAVRQQELAEQAAMAEASVRESEERYRALFTSIDEGFCVIEVLFDDHGKAIDYLFLEVNPTFVKQSGLRDAVGKRMRELRPNHEEHWFEIYGKVALTGEPIRFVSEAKELSGQWYDLYACRVGGAQSRRVAVVFNDITTRKNSEDALRDSHARFEKLFDTSPVGMYLVDAQLRIVKMNDKTRAAFGDIEDLVGRDFLEVVQILWPPDIAADIVAHFRSTLATGESYHHGELSEVRYDRDVREYYDWELHRLVMPDGQHGVVCYFLDISARVLAQQALRESETRYRRLFQTAKDGVLILDANTGKITDVNAFMCGLVGMDACEILGRELYEIGMFRDIEENKAAFRELQNSRYLRHDHLPVRNRRGEEVYVEFVANVYLESDKLVAQCNVRDIAERTRMEKQIGAQAEALADLARRKDVFLATLSHELRNPLAPIRSAVHLLKLHESGNGDPIQRQAREIIERQVGNLTKLVNDLLEVSRVISGRIRLDLQPVDLKQAVEHALHAVAPLIEQHKHTVVVNHCPEPVLVLADSTRLEEILVNLLNNAVKYTPDGGRIEVTCEQPLEGDDRHALVRVRDNGMGIEKQVLPHVFELFTQADRSLARSAGGLGIGLSLAHRLVDLHGGMIEARSEGPGQGAEFLVRLPLMAANGASSPVTPAQTLPRGDGARILLVDDNMDQVIMLAIGLRHKGYDVRTACTGPEGLEAAQQWCPDIVLLDIGLPGMDGYSVARRLRANPTMGNAGAEMRIIALSGYGSDTDKALAREAGFDAHLTKPFGFDELDKMLTVPNA